MYVFIVRFVTVLLLSVGFVSAEPPTLEPGDVGYGEKPVYRIEYLDNQKSLLGIDDTIYKMALNMEVYNSRGQKVNRFALKKGQKIEFSYTRRNQGRFINKIDIVQ